MISDYDKEEDILCVYWGSSKVKESIELFNGSLILDLDKDLNPVGMEVIGYMNQIKKQSKRIKEMFKEKKWNMYSKKDV